MIALTHNCGCPLSKQPSLITKPVGLQACSLCCFHSTDVSHYAHRQMARQYSQFKKDTYLSTKDRVSGCIKNFHCVPSRSKSIRSEYKSSIYCCCATSKMHSGFSHRPISKTTLASKENTGKQHSRSKRKKESKWNNLEMVNAEETPTERVVSEIVRKGQPYKEIEAVINDNRVIIRTHKEPVKGEYDPPCECIGQDAAAKESLSSLKKCDDGVVFEMADGNLELRCTPREDASSTKGTCDQEETGCRTTTLYPNITDVERVPTASHLGGERVRRSKVERLLDLEENPNIFVLRIRKHCENGDKKQKIDLEFRAPRPWQPRKAKKKKLHIDLAEHEEHEELANHEEDTNMENNNEI